MSNRLAAEKSPYLLQHAHNPVDWFPWGEEAFALARSRDKPIFLSVGYSTCHWCHVMERESFEDPEVARLLNETFVCIKVDREERPDVDGIYMTAAQMISGRGGWPLTVLLTPALTPFYAATYIPRDSRPGLIGMADFVPRIGELWRTRRADVDRSAAEITAAVARAAATPPGQPLEPTALLSAVRAHFVESFDADHGGFGPAPRFPTPHNLVLLLRAFADDAAVTSMAEQTLRAMRAGGTWDHVGFGFHRYSTDERWLVPHFEKMLYDQALIAIACMEAFVHSGARDLARCARDTLEYVLRDLRSPEGALYSAEDADSEGEEGRFYLWTAAEIRGLVGGDAQAVLRLMNAGERGNFRDEAAGIAGGRNILHCSAPATASQPDPALDAAWERARPLLFAARASRPRPQRDDKVLTDWNGLAIAALARTGRLLGDEALVRAGAAAADFVLRRLRAADGTLLHRWCDGEAAIDGMLDDYAFLLWGLIELHQATLQPSRLAEAVRIADLMLERFRDEDGALLATSRAAPALLVSRKESFDHATPSGNSVGAHELVRLSRLTGRPEYERAARGILAAFSGRLLDHPQYHTHMLSALTLAETTSVEVVIAADAPEAVLPALARLHPVRVAVLGKRPGDGLESIAPFTAAMEPLSGRPTWYVCSGHACRVPTTDGTEALRQIAQLSAVN